ncbi:MAG: hypothetical protein IPL26_26490 [Leptospiraceae bacterium]|nr:hypothetical protein [Leptospiraceae bacterium]
MNENIYTTDDILIKTGKVILILLLFITFSGQCIQYFRYSEKNSFEVKFKTKDGDTYQTEEILTNSTMRKVIKSDPLKFFKNKFQNLETATASSKNNDDYDLKFKNNSKIKNQTVKDINQLIHETDKIEYLREKYPNSILVQKMEESKRSEIVNQSLRIFSLILIIGGIIPISFLFAGYKIRTKENKILAIKAMLEKSLDTSIQDIQISTGLTKKFILEAIGVINLRGFGYFVIDSNSNRIMDARLRTEWILIDKCPSCGAAINQKVTLSLNNAPECPYCKNPFPWNFLNELKRKTINEIYSQEHSKEQIIQPIQLPKRNFSIGIFLLLLILIWPLAIYYAISRDKKRS